MRIALRLNLDRDDSDVFATTEMSRGFQRVHRRIVRRFSARGAMSPGPSAIVPKLRARVMVDGQEFANARQMPPEYRQFYDEMLARVLPVQRAVQIVTRAEHANFIKRSITLSFVASSCVAAVVYLWLHGYYG